MITGHELRVRGRQPGDRLSLPGGTKSVKALMIDKKIPVRLRDSLPVLTLNGKPIAVFGLGADPAYLSQQESPALILSLIPDPY